MKAIHAPVFLHATFVLIPNMANEFKFQSHATTEPCRGRIEAALVELKHAFMMTRNTSTPATIHRTCMTFLLNKTVVRWTQFDVCHHIVFLASCKRCACFTLRSCFSPHGVNRAHQVLHQAMSSANATLCYPSLV